MKPYKILLILLSVLLLLFLISLVFPEEGIKISQDLKLDFPSFKDIIHRQKADYKDISHILASTSLNLDDTSETTVQVIDSLIQNKPSGLFYYDSVNIPFDTVRVKADSIKKLIYKIQYPEDDKSVLYPFFRELKNLKNKNKHIRIIHYGDSQIEGDRITSFIRDKLQKTFGGMGIGLFPAKLLNKYALSMVYDASDNWHKYTVRDIVDTVITHRRLGALASFSRFTPYPESIQSNEEIHEGWVSMRKSEVSYFLCRKYTQCRVFYGYNSDPLIVELYVDTILLDADILIPERKLNILKWTFDNPPDEITLKFSGEDSPDVFGIALDDTIGIAVDNIPLRGSAGLDFAAMDPDILKEMLNKLETKLLIMQFGVNVVPNIVDDYSYYENLFYYSLNKIKQIQPDLSIIVMGVSDMSRKVRGIYESYPNIEKIRDAQRNAAFKAGCAFWDIYEAMGGHNSMPSWVFSDPPLAQKDFIHYSPLGAKILAEMFYNAFITEYNEFLLQENN